MRHLKDIEDQNSKTIYLYSSFIPLKLAGGNANANGHNYVYQLVAVW